MILLLGWCSPAGATPGIATETGQPCLACHLSPSGGDLSASGERWAEDPSAWIPPAAPPAPPGFLLRLLHLAALAGHIIFGVLWTGTILFVHLVLKPKYALSGLPKSELKLAWVSMPLVALTGILLTVYRLHFAPGLFSTRWGILLGVKTGVFVSMVSSAAFVTLFIGPRLKARAQSRRDLPTRAVCPAQPPSGLTPELLAGYDGKDGRRALVAVAGEVFEVTGSRMWKEGLHARRHQAGQDLTASLDAAPHGPEVLERMARAGTLGPGKEKPDPVVRLFLVNAYWNLTGVFAILVILALWGW